MSHEATTWAYQQPITNSGLKFVLVALADKADEVWSCFPGQALLAEMTGQSERSVRRHVQLLEDEGYIRRERRFNGDGYRTSDRYVLVKDRPTGQIDHRSNRPPANLTTGQPVRPYRPKSTTLPAKIDDLTGQSDRVTVREPSENRQEEPSDTRPPSFDDFWAIYPKRVAKGDAEKAWKAAVKKTEPVAIVAGAKRYAADRQRDPKFTKHPGTWIRAQCWLDEAPPPHKSARYSNEEVWNDETTEIVL